MTTSTKIAATTAIALLLAVTGSANAASIEDQLTDQQVSTFCVNQPIGSDVQAAASSMARGKPSSRWQMVMMVAAFSAVNVNSGSSA